MAFIQEIIYLEIYLDISSDISETKMTKLSKETQWLSIVIKIMKVFHKIYDCRKN